MECANCIYWDQNLDLYMDKYPDDKWGLCNGLPYQLDDKNGWSQRRLLLKNKNDYFLPIRQRQNRPYMLSDDSCALFKKEE